MAATPFGRVLVTGASAGIGAAFADLIAAERHDLVLVARRADRLQEIAARLRGAHGVAVDVVDEDLAAPDGPRRVAVRASAGGKPVDVLINNAGFGARGPFAAIPLERQLAMVQVNVTALVALTGLLLPGMLQRGRGGVLNVASTAAFQPGPRMAIYYATKAFVLSFSEALHEEVRGRGVAVTCLCPGPTESEFTKVAGMKETLLFRIGTARAAAVARSGWQALRRNRAIAVHGAANRAGAFLVRFAPRLLVRRAVARLQ